jgi:uncharacterized membrane protein YraQ (UPF0718 family)
MAEVRPDSFSSNPQGIVYNHSFDDLIQEFFRCFTGILYEALPFIVLGVVIAGILEEFVPQQLITKIIPRNRVLAIAIGGFLGALFPMCECGIIPVMRRLLRKGVPLSCCVCYMLAGPIINVVVMLSTYYAFAGKRDTIGGGLGMMGLRMGLGYLVAFSTSLIVEWQYRKHGRKLLAPRALADAEAGDPDEEGTVAVRRPFFQRLSNISETALHDFVDITLFLILGGLLAALTRVILPREQMIAMFRGQPELSILMMMALAILLCICSEADAFVAASFEGVTPAANLAFLVLGPMLDFKLYMMYTRVFRPRLIWTIIIAVVVQVFLVATLTHHIADYLGLLPPVR